jgi:signal transduction histidine kinase
MEIDFQKYPLLFVDDEEESAIGFQRQYKKEFKIFTAVSGRDGLTLLQAHPEIAVIISDQRMPGMQGTDFLSLSREIAPSAIRMLITAHSDMAVVIDAINKGSISRYVNKPYNEGDMRYAIYQAIEYYHVVKERNQLYAERIETLKKVARANRLSAIGTLAAGMAHEINNPLVAVSSFLQMLPKKRKTPKDEEYWTDFYHLAVKETQRIKTLITQLLSYSKVSPGSEIYHKDLDLTHPIDLNGLVQEAVILLKNEARKQKTEFRLILDPKLPQGKMDAEMIRQMIVNLILNAIQATQSGKITLTTAIYHNHIGQGFVELTVSDTGIGISGEALDQLFSPFFTTKGAEGTGLGLVTCHHIVEQHRGTIGVRSQLGIGTTIAVQIPLDPLNYDRREIERRDESEPSSET